MTSVFLGLYMAVQASHDVERRFRFLFFSAVCFSIAGLDLLHPFFDAQGLLHIKELLRVFAWSCYAAGTVALLSQGLKQAVSAALTFLLLAALVWQLLGLDLMSTITFSTIFAYLSFAHWKHYLKNNGFASCVLSAYSLGLGLICTSFYLGLKTGPDVIILGFFNFMLLQVLAVIFGWVQLPRELRGSFAVKVEKKYAIVFFIFVVAAECWVLPSIFMFRQETMIPYLISNLFLIIPALVLYFHHRHLLVIHTDNVEELLGTRTRDLVKVKEELAVINKIQEKDLNSQANELEEQHEVIARQRRLELAAQTAGQVAHDFQNYFIPILELINKSEKLSEISDFRANTIEMRNQFENLIDLNAQTLALSRRGRVETSPIKIDELVNDLASRFPAHPLETCVEGELWVLGSWVQLSRVVLNLMTNAFEAINPKNGAVSISCELTDINETRGCYFGFLKPGKWVVIKVSDNGSGIPDNILTKIFDPFYSTKRSNTSSGTGLGLCTVQAILIEDHKGALDLNTSDEGTTMIIYLEAIEAPSILLSESAGSPNETVLVTDDDTNITERYQAILEKAGYHVLTAENGRAALKLLQVQHADLMLLDVDMPSMGGVEAFFAAQQMRPKIKAIVHSSYVNEQIKEEFYQHGVHDFLEKPANPQLLLQTVRAVLDEAQQSDSL